MVGVETAEFCKDYCERVAVVEMQDELASDLYMTVRDDLKKRFKEKGIEVYKNTRVKRIGGNCVYADKDGQEHHS